MSENKTKYFVNLSGTEVDFSGVATDSVPEVDISDDILEEKLSYLMLWRNPSYFSVYTNRPAKDPCWDCENSKESNPRLFTPDCRSGHNLIEYVDPCDKKRQFLYPYENYSFLSYANGNMVHVCEDEGIPFKERYAYGKLPHYDRTLRNYFKEGGIYSPVKIDDAIVCHQTILGKLLDHFYPKQTNWRPPQQTLYNKKENYHLPLSFRFNRESGVGDSLVLKAYNIWDHQFLKAYYPVSLVHLPKNKPKELQYSIPDQLWAKIPREDRQKLYNLDKIITAKKVVICAAIEDAWILQRTNDTTDVVFTSFKCDGWKYDQVDFSELKDKEIIILISNYNGSSLAEEYCDTEKLVSHLESIKISNISFVQREIVYPSIEGIWSYQELVDVYKKQPPTIKEKSLMSFTREQFDEYLKRAKEEVERKEAESVDKPFYLQEEKIVFDSEEDTEVKSIYDKMLIRPVLYEGTVTVLSALAKTGKTRFTLKLCKLLITKNSRESAISGMAIKKCYREPESEKCAVYLAYDKNISNEIDSIKKNDFNNSDLFVSINLKELGNLPKGDANAMIEKIREKAVYKSTGKPIPVGMIVIDTVRAFSGQDKNVDIVKNVSNKLTEAFPLAAIMWIHHLNKEGKASGGDEFVGVATINIMFERYKDFSNSNKKFHYSILDSNLLFSDEDAEANVCRTEEGDFSTVDPERTDDEMELIAYKNYTKKVKGKKVMKANQAANLLGYKEASAIRHKKMDQKQ